MVETTIIVYIFLIIFLGVTTIIFLLLWIYELNYNNTLPITSICYGEFGLETGLDAQVINTCGTNNNSPCIFAQNTLAEAQTQCNSLKSICNAFSFNATTSTMKVVNPQSSYPSILTDLFKRQNI